MVGCHAVLFSVARRHARFEPNTVLWTFHTIQPSSTLIVCHAADCSIFYVWARHLANSPNNVVFNSHHGNGVSRRFRYRQWGWVWGGKCHLPTGWGKGFGGATVGYAMTEQMTMSVDTVAAWRSCNSVGRINEVTLRRARLVLGWVTCPGSTPGGGTLFWYVTSHAGRLSLSSFRGR